jgi:hypothetical protein
VVFILGLFFTTGCSNTWIDDDGNFRRVFGYDKPPDVQIVHSYYWQKPRWSGGREYRYFFAQRGPDGMRDVMGKDKSMNLEQPDSRARYGCGGSPPSWFVSKSPDHYEMWVMKDWSGGRVFRDKDDSTWYRCAGEP